jgi:hypothetical protein
MWVIVGCVSVFSSTLLRGTWVIESCRDGVDVIIVVTWEYSVYNFAISNVIDCSFRLLSFFLFFFFLVFRCRAYGLIDRKVYKILYHTFIVVVSRLSYKIGDFDSGKLERVFGFDHLSELADLLRELADKVEELYDEDPLSLELVSVKVKLKKLGDKWVELTVDDLENIVEGFIMKLDGEW